MKNMYKKLKAKKPEVKKSLKSDDSLIDKDNKLDNVNIYKSVGYSGGSIHASMGSGIYKERKLLNAKSNRDYTQHDSDGDDNNKCCTIQ